MYRLTKVYRTWTDHDARFLTEPVDFGRETCCYLQDPDVHLIEVGQRTSL